MIDVDAKVRRVDVHLDVIGQDGEHLHASEGRLATLLVVGGRYSHETVHALLGAKHAVGVLARDGERGAVDADDFRLRGVVDGDLPSASVAVAQIHVEEHVAPVLGLEPALAGRDGDDGVAVVEVVGEPARELEVGEV